jgi:hypothetical protein
VENLAMVLPEPTKTKTCRKSETGVTLADGLAPLGNESGAAEECEKGQS